MAHPIVRSDLIVLAVLCTEPCYGARIQQEAETRGVKLSIATVYQATRKLIDQGLIIESKREPSPSGGPETIWFAPTDEGRSALQSHRQTLVSALSVG